MRLVDFNQLILANGEVKLDYIAEKYLIQGVPYVFDSDEGKFYDFRKRVADNFSVGSHEIFIVGSAKQGFSYFKQRDDFTYQSDIDVAIVSDTLYDEFEKIVREYLYKKKEGLIVLDKKDEKKLKFLLMNMALGWIRPDIFPDIFEDSSYLSFFRSISFGNSEVGDYEVKAGIFKSYNHLLRYHIFGLSSKLKELKVRETS